VALVALDATSRGCGETVAIAKLPAQKQPYIRG